MCTFYKCHLQFHLTWWKFNIWVRLFCWRSLNTVPCLGVFQSKMSQAVYTAAISQQSVQNMYISNTVQAAPGWQRRQKQRGVHHPDLTVCNDSELTAHSFALSSHSVSFAFLPMAKKLMTHCSTDRTWRCFSILDLQGQRATGRSCRAERILEPVPEHNTEMERHGNKFIRTEGRLGWSLL